MLIFILDLLGIVSKVSEVLPEASNIVLRGLDLVVNVDSFGDVAQELVIALF